MPITLVYAVPVYITVADDRDEVISVKVDNRPVPAVYTHARGHDGRLLNPEEDLDRISRATQVARDVPWPDWEFAQIDW